MNHIRTQVVKTRKPHHCSGCDIIWPPGTEMTVCVYTDGGEIFSNYWCIPCGVVGQDRNCFSWYDGEFIGMDGEIKREYPEEWEEARVSAKVELPRDQGRMYIPLVQDGLADFAKDKTDGRK